MLYDYLLGRITAVIFIICCYFSTLGFNILITLKFNRNEVGAVWPLGGSTTPQMLTGSWAEGDW